MDRSALRGEGGDDKDDRTVGLYVSMFVPPARCWKMDAVRITYRGDCGPTLKYAYDDSGFKEEGADDSVGEEIGLELLRDACRSDERNIVDGRPHNV